MQGKPKRVETIGWGVDEKTNACILFRTISKEKKQFEFYNLNLVGGRVWGLCDGTREPNQIVDQIVSEFSGDREKIRREIIRFINQMYKLGLLDIEASA